MEDDVLPRHGASCELGKDPVLPGEDPRAEGLGEAGDLGRQAVLLRVGKAEILAEALGLRVVRADIQDVQDPEPCLIGPCVPIDLHVPVDLHGGEVDKTCRPKGPCGL